MQPFPDGKYTTIQNIRQAISRQQTPSPRGGGDGGEVTGLIASRVTSPVLFERAREYILFHHVLCLL